MSTQIEKPSYYAIIPAKVRYANISDKAKLIFGEITCLSNEKGYCYASNKYFANLYKTAEETITRYIQELKGKGFVKVRYEKVNGCITKRIITVDENIKVDKNINRTVDKNVNRTVDENVKENNTSINNTSMNKESKKEEGYKDIINRLLSTEEEKKEMLELVKSRMLNKHKPTNHALELLCKKAMKFPQEERIQIIQNSTMNGWQDLYPLKKKNTKERELDIREREIAHKERVEEVYKKDVEIKAKKSMNNIEKTIAISKKTDEMMKIIGGKNDKQRCNELDISDKSLLPNDKDI